LGGKQKGKNSAGRQPSDSNYHTVTVPWVSSLLVYPADFGLAFLHSYVSQFLKIKHTSAHTHTHTHTHWFCFSREPWLNCWGLDLTSWDSAVDMELHSFVLVVFSSFNHLWMSQVTHSSSETLKESHLFQETSLAAASAGIKTPTWLRLSRMSN
jgi:hypothetical protein